MDRAEIERLLRRVGGYLQEQDLTGEILLVGGAYMTLVLRQRETTKDVDAYFAAHAEAIRTAAARVAHESGLPADWLNDAVKGFLYTQPDVATVWLECPGLRVYAPHPSYIFAMKAVAGRPEDLRDLRALRDHLGLASAAEALDVVVRYVPERLLSPRVQYLVEDLFDAADA
jgi:predicted nucleotidyltransferase